MIAWLEGQLETNMAYECCMIREERCSGYHYGTCLMMHDTCRV